jgi:hypothetical protein
MAAPYNPPKKNEDFKIRVALQDNKNPERFKINPTIATGDFKIVKDGGMSSNLTTLPTVSPAGSVCVLIELSATETNADYIAIVARDQTTPAEWRNFMLGIVTTQ